MIFEFKYSNFASIPALFFVHVPSPPSLPRPKILPSSSSAHFLSPFSFGRRSSSFPLPSSPYDSAAITAEARAALKVVVVALRRTFFLKWWTHREKAPKCGKWWNLDDAIWSNFYFWCILCWKGKCVTVESRQIIQVQFCPPSPLPLGTKGGA